MTNSPRATIEPTTKAADASNLNKHFYPFLGRIKLLGAEVKPRLAELLSQYA